MAPDFALESDGEETVQLSKLRGSRVVLFFYPRDDTSGCTKEACGFRDSAEAFEDLGAVVLGVSPDDVRSHERFRDKYGLNFPLLADPGHRVADAYGVWGTKRLYGRKHEGILRTTFVIDPEGRVERVYRNVKPAGHAAELLDHLSDGGGK